MEKKETKTVSIQILEVKNIKYFENPLTDFNFKNKFNPTKAAFRIDMRMAIFEDLEILELILQIVYKNIEDRQEYDLFGITTSHKFKMLELKQHLTKDEKGQYQVPNQILASMLGISLSGTRGMLSLLNNNDDYRKIVLPVMNPTEMLKNLNKKNQ